MSFFNDFSSLFNLSELKNKSMVNLILGVGVVVIGKIKLNVFNDNIIDIFVEKEKIEIIGNDLKITSIGKGEMIVSGNIKSVNVGA